MSVKLANNAHDVLAAAISSTDTSLTVDDASTFPSLGAGEYFYCTLESINGVIEIVKVTAISGTTFTIVRGQEDTIAVPFHVGSRVGLRITVQNLEDQFEDAVATELADEIAAGVDISEATVTADGSNTAIALKYWLADPYNVLAFGAVWDGSSHPLSGYYATLAEAQAVYPHATALTNEIDWAATQLAINSLPDAGGAVTVPEGTGLFDQMLTLGDGSAANPSTQQNIKLTGKSVPAGNQITPQNYGTRIKFTGANNTDAVIRLLGPITVFIDGFHIDCNFLANSGVWATHMFRSNIRNCYVGKHKGIAWRLDCWPTAFSNITTGGSINVLDHCFCGEPGSSSTTAIKIGNAVTEADATDMQRLVVQNSSFLCGNSTSSVGVHFEYCDQVLFYNVFVTSGVAPNSCNAKLFKITGSPGGVYPTTTKYFPQNIYMCYTYFICDGVNGYDIDPDWVSQNGRGVMWWPFMRGEVELATHPVPSHALFWGITDSGVLFGDQFGELSDIAALTTTSFGRALLTMADAAALRTAAGLTANGQSLVTAADYSAMRTLLGLVPGTDVQAYDADLTTWSGLTPSANFQTMVPHTFAQMRTDLSLVPGTNVQAWDADLDTWATLTPSANFQTMVPHTFSQMCSDLGLVIGTNVQAWDADLDTWATVTPSANGKSLVAAADYVAMCKLMGVPYVIGQSAATGMSVTGTTSETTLATITIPANAIGPNGSVEVDCTWSCTNNANTKTTRVKFGGTQFDTSNPASSAAQRRTTYIANRNATNSQVSGSTGQTGGVGAISTPTTLAIDTTSSQNITITAQLTNTGDTMTLERYIVKVCYGA